MTMFDLIDDGAQFTAQSFMESYTKEFRDPVGSQSPKADLAAAFENLMDREVALKDEVAAVFYLPDGVKARQVHLFTLGLRELRSQDQCPAVELICRHVVDGQKCVIVLRKAIWARSIFDVRI